MWAYLESDLSIRVAFIICCQITIDCIFHKETTQVMYFFKFPYYPETWDSDSLCKICIQKKIVEFTEFKKRGKQSCTMVFLICDFLFITWIFEFRCISRAILEYKKIQFFKKVQCRTRHWTLNSPSIGVVYVDA